MAPEIIKIETIEFSYTIPDVGVDGNGFNLVYEPGSRTDRKLFAIRIHTDVGITGEYVGGNSPRAAQINTFADFLVGKNPLEREKLWSEVKRALRKYDRMGMGPIDIALWDFAGKYYDAPIHELLGTYRERIPAYASTYNGGAGGTLHGASTGRSRPSTPSVNASATKWILCTTRRANSKRTPTR